MNNGVCFGRRRRGRAAFCENEGREIRTPNLLIWSQTRCRCAIPPCEPLGRAQEIAMRAAEQQTKFNMCCGRGRIDNVANLGALRKIMQRGSNPNQERGAQTAQVSKKGWRAEVSSSFRNARRLRATTGFYRASASAHGSRRHQNPPHRRAWEDGRPRCHARRDGKTLWENLRRFQR